uniref:Receptor expression-enhancing protein n=1 Tax=Romanomermis culicivorax TaxID=13658 RepID=A0A915HUV5_ROMCU
NSSNCLSPGSSSRNNAATDGDTTVVTPTTTPAAANKSIRWSHVIEFSIESGRKIWRHFYDQLKTNVLLMLSPILTAARSYGLTDDEARKTVITCIGLAIFLLIFGSSNVQRFISGLLVVPYALLRTSRLLFKDRNPEIREVKQWLLFWAIYAEIELVEFVLLFVIPFYWSIKTYFFLVLCTPPFELCKFWYEHYVENAPNGDNRNRYAKSIGLLLMTIPLPIGLLSLFSTLWIG